MKQMNETATKENVVSSSLSLTERLRSITTAALLASGLLVGGTAQASVTRSSPIVNRAIAVQNLMKAKLTAEGGSTKTLPRAQVLVAQWGNSWANWNNWSNWDNWGNWGNWGNWRNF